MFRKLLRYDMMSVWRLWWIILFTMPVVSVVGAFALRLTITCSDSEKIADAFISLIGGFTGIACIMVIPVASILTAILVYLRFYKNLFSDEGYLTFTLPVSRRSILLSKTLNAFIWFAAYGLLTLICIVIFLLITPPPRDGEFINLVVFEEIGKIFAMTFKEGWGGWFVLYVFEAVIALLVSQLFGISLVHFCITVGSVVAKNLKILTAIGIYYGVTVLMSAMNQIVSFIITYGMADGLRWYLSSYLPTGYPVMGIVIFIMILAVAALAAIFYSLTQWLIDRKLNLA